MTPFAYLFERFPSFSQTFCYREIVGLDRQDLRPPVFSIRQPKDEPPQDWDQRIVERVHYLPGEAELLDEVRRASKKGKLTKEIIAALDEWGRRPDFLRLFQAVYVGARLQENGIRHVHAHFAGMAARTAFWIGEFFGIRFSFTAHANDIFAPRNFEVGLGKLVDAARVVVTESDYAAKFLRERFPDSADRIHRVYNGLDLSQFQCADFSNPVSSIVAVGRLIEKKGFADLIRACGLLANRGRRFRCEIIGEGPLEDELRAQIEEIGLRAHVMLAGPLPQQQIAKRLAAASVFALPCIVEKSGGMDNLPTVIMEAMAAGLPVVATPIGAVPEMVAQDETGILVPPHDPVKLAEAIERVIVDRALAQRLGEHGHQRAKELFSIDENVRALLALFNGFSNFKANRERS
jgi:colanic acid/amylovoran biosynthesis glycosyltransferase